MSTQKDRILMTEADYLQRPDKSNRNRARHGTFIRGEVGLGNQVWRPMYDGFLYPSQLTHDTSDAFGFLIHHAKDDPINRIWIDVRFDMAQAKKSRLAVVALQRSQVHVGDWQASLTRVSPKYNACWETFSTSRGMSFHSDGFHPHFLYDPQALVVIDRNRPLAILTAPPRTGNDIPTFPHEERWNAYQAVRCLQEGLDPRSSINRDHAAIIGQLDWILLFDFAQAPDPAHDPRFLLHHAS